MALVYVTSIRVDESTEEYIERRKWTDNSRI